jgi:very-short-patch-repair endonuclease
MKINLDAKRSKNSRYARNLRANPTHSEVVFKSKIQGLSLGKVMFQKGFISKGLHCIVDFYLPDYKLVIEIDGAYHNNDKQIEKDKHRDIYLTKTRHFNLIRMTNEQACSMGREDIMKMVKSFEGNRSKYLNLKLSE